MPIDMFAACTPGFRPKGSLNACCTHSACVRRIHSVLDVFKNHNEFIATKSRHLVSRPYRLQQVPCRTLQQYRIPFLLCTCLRL